VPLAELTEHEEEHKAVRGTRNSGPQTLDASTPTNSLALDTHESNGNGNRRWASYIAGTDAHANSLEATQDHALIICSKVPTTHK
jgi:hypothetical protein